MNDYSTGQQFLSRAVFAKELDMNCMDDQVDIARTRILIFQLQLTLENWKLFDTEMESPTSEVKLKEQVVALLHLFGTKCTALKDWMSENMRTWRKGICSSWIIWKFSYFFSMTKINLIHTELSFEVKETSRIKSSDVHITQKLKGV